MRLVLASASPARLGVLQAAGLDPLVEVADVDEHALLAATPTRALAPRSPGWPGRRPPRFARRIADAHPHAVVVGCDSMLLLDGELQGKPGDPDMALAALAGHGRADRRAVTGHTVLRTADGAIDRVAEGHAVTRGAVRPLPRPSWRPTSPPASRCRRGRVPLDGLGGWFVEGIDGDPSNVIGISLPLAATAARGGRRERHGPVAARLGWGA